MKKIKKILPILATTAIGTIPFAATSCSNVWLDLLSKPYTPKFTKYSATDNTNEVTSQQAINAFKEKFLKDQGDLTPDFYWGSSHYARIGLQSESRNVLTFLQYLSNISLKDAPAGGFGPILSYRSKTQMEIKDWGLGGSYAINTYDLDWELNNIAVWPVYYATSSDGAHCWAISPIKFDTYHSVWWRELTGNERIKFDFKAVFKGYGKNGGQNYVRETSEAAIIDEAHKYVPELNEVYTNVMLFDSYYLSGVAPKIKFGSSDLVGKWDTDHYKCGNLDFYVGPNTAKSDLYKDDSLYFSIYNNKTYVSSVLGSDAEVEAKDITIPKSVTMASIKEAENYHFAFAPTFKITSGTPLPLDRLYYIIQIDCKDSEKATPKWTDYLFVSTLISVEE